MSDNFSRIALLSHKNKFVDLRANIRKSLNSLSDNKTVYAEHHQHLINVYTGIIDDIENGIADSHEIG